MGDDVEISTSELNQLRVVCDTSFKSDADVMIAHCDTLAFLRTIPDESIRLVVSSPPYNIGKPYEERTELDKYLEWQLSVLQECVRVLAPDGSLCWEVGNHIDSREVYPLDFYFYQILKEVLGLKLRNRIIWSFEHGLHASRRFSGVIPTNRLARMLPSQVW